MLPGEIARRALTDDAAKWFARLVWSTRLVVIGVLVEGIAVIHELVGIVKHWLQCRNERAHFRTLMEIFPLSQTFVHREPGESHTPTLVKLIAFLGLIAVAIGVAGEWKYEVKFEAATDAIQTFDSKQTHDAATSATIARGEADAATLASGKAQNTANAANRTSDQAKAKAAELEDALILARITLKRYIDVGLKQPAPREFPISIMLSMLKKAPPANAIILYRSVATSEPYRVAQTISLVLKHAGWKISEPFKYPEPYNIGRAANVDGLPFNVDPLPEMGRREILIIASKLATQK